MKKSFFFFLSAAVLLLTIPSCQKGSKWKKHTVIEEYEYAEGQTLPEEQKKVSKIWHWKAARMAKDMLKEGNLINEPIVVPVEVGYYECNDLQERENLYKLQVNGLLNVTYSEIKNKYERPTYWVDVQLTGKGKSLIIKDKAPVFPEDTINPDYMKVLVNPETGLNQYGEYTFDPNVPEDIVALIKNFYGAYLNDKKGAINQYGTPDLIKAEQRIDIANGLDIHRLSKDPFLRENQISQAAVDAMTITKWTPYVDLYIACINNMEYCIVVKENEGMKRIDDIALQNPLKMQVNKTVRCTAAGISAKELHRALLAQEAKARHAKPQAPAKNKKAAEPKVQEPEVLQFDEYNPQRQPGIELVEHAEPTLYEIAKAAEHSETFNLLAGTYKYDKLGKLKLNKQAKQTEYRAPVYIKLAKVTALGRIFFNLHEGDTFDFEMIYKYDEDEGWVAEMAAP